MEWQQVIDNPFLQDLPFKIELNKWGKILMSPASNNHGIRQYEVAKFIDTGKQSGKIIIECSIKTPEGVKVADVVWASDEFISKYGDKTPYDFSPEICVEIISPSNSQAEMDEKIKLYINQGAKEVWLCDQKGGILYYSHAGKINKSNEID